jgi:hypothetical protein
LKSDQKTGCMYYSVRIPPGGMHTPLYPWGVWSCYSTCRRIVFKKVGGIPDPPPGGWFLRRLSILQPLLPSSLTPTPRGGLGILTCLGSLGKRCRPTRQWSEGGAPRADRSAPAGGGGKACSLPAAPLLGSSALEVSPTPRGSRSDRQPQAGLAYPG